MFGNLGAPSSNTTTGGFGATASPFPLGRQQLTPQTGAFGGTNTSNTGGAFGAKPAGGFGAFGGGTSAFGGGGTSAFGQPATTAAPGTTSVFGQPAAPAPTSAFGTSSSLFGGNKTFGSTPGKLPFLTLFDPPHHDHDRRNSIWHSPCCNIRDG